MEFIDLVLQHHHKLRAHLNKKFTSIPYDDREDILQTTYMTAWAKRHQLRDPHLLGGWLYKIMSTCALSYLRSQARPINKNTVRTPHIDEVAASASPTQYDGLLLSERRALLEAAVRWRTPQDYDVVRLRQDGLSFREISDLTGKSLGAVKGSYYHAVERVKEVIA